MANVIMTQVTSIKALHEMRETPHGSQWHQAVRYLEASRGNKNFASKQTEMGLLKKNRGTVIYIFLENMLNMFL